jgi:hypothetical protein
MATISRGVVVPAIPPRPPQVTLIGSSIRPGDSADPSAPIFELGDDALGLLPDDLRSELEARKGEAWVRGLTYAPENHRAPILRDPCDFTSVDTPALEAPRGLTLTEEAGKGSIAAVEVEYQVTAVNANGETTALAAVKETLKAEGGVLLQWDRTAENVQYKVYGRLAGVLKLIATVGPFDLDEPVQWLDEGTIAPGASAPPVSNTTGGPGSYGNLPIVVFVPYLVVVDDDCSTFGFEERDFKGRALRLLDNATPWGVEHELWTGALAAAKGWPNNSLMNEERVEDVTPPTVPSVERGLAILQDALASCGFGGQGMIHIPSQAPLSMLKVRRVGQMVYDVMDNLVIPGAGYPGTGPGGAMPKAGCAFLAATDLVMTRTESEGTIFPDSFAEAMDWGQGGEPNTIRFQAQRYAAAYFDGACQFAVEVQLPS